MQDLVLKILMVVFGSISAGGIGLLFWNIKKNNGKDERREERRELREFEMLKDVTIMKTEFKMMKENWKDKKVDKAYDSAKRAHHRIDPIEEKVNEL